MAGRRKVFAASGRYFFRCVLVPNGTPYAISEASCKRATGTELTVLIGPSRGWGTCCLEDSMSSFSREFLVAGSTATLAAATSTVSAQTDPLDSEASAFAAPDAANDVFENAAQRTFGGNKATQIAMPLGGNWSRLDLFERLRRIAGLFPFAHVPRHSPFQRVTVATLLKPLLQCCVLGLKRRVLESLSAGRKNRG